MQSELLHERESTPFFCILSSLEPEAVSAAAVCNAGAAHLKSHSLVACQVASVLVQIFVTPWTVTRQAPLPMGFSRQEYWSRLPFLPPGNKSKPENKFQINILAISGKPTKRQRKLLSLKYDSIKLVRKKLFLVYPNVAFSHSSLNLLSNINKPNASV